MFSGARNSARGPSGKKRKPRAIARTLKLGGRGRPRAAGKLAFSFAGGCSKVCCAPPSAQLHLARMAHLAHWARLAHGASGAFVPPCAPPALGAPGTRSRAHRFPNLRCVYPRLLSHLAHLVRLARAAHSAVLAPWQHVHMSRGSSLRATEPSSQGGGLMASLALLVQQRSRSSVFVRCGSRTSGPCPLSRLTAGRAGTGRGGLVAGASRAGRGSGRVAICAGPSGLARGRPWPTLARPCCVDPLGAAPRPSEPAGASSIILIARGL